MNIIQKRKKWRLLKVCAYFLFGLMIIRYVILCLISTTSRMRTGKIMFISNETGDHRPSM